MHNEDQTVWVTFNGEIFNYLELRTTLLKEGHCFHTQSDTEVIVHAYEQYGGDFVQHLNGQFAIALWDENRQRLLLARDRVGILPLFYTRQGERLLFASEIKALLRDPAVARRVDPQALEDYLSLQFVLGERTLFDGIRKVEPAHWQCVDLATLAVRSVRYWAPDYTSAGSSAGESSEDAAARVRSLIEGAVARQMRSDVPVGAYLSGGLDSSLVCSMASLHAGGPIHCASPIQLRCISAPT